MLCSTGSIALLYGKHCFVPVEAMTYITVCVVLCCDSGKWNSLINLHSFLIQQNCGYADKTV